MAEEVEKKPENIFLPDQEWNDEHAKNVVLQDFETAQNYRSSNHDKRWMNAALLYSAWRAQKYWEGTRIPRASIPVFLCFQQVESLLPRIMREIFADPYWFDAVPKPGTTPDEARAARDLILSQADDVGENPARKVQFREVMRRAVKSALIYGNGILELSWTRKVVNKKKWVTKDIPRYKKVFDPVLGPQIIPLGVERKSFKKVIPVVVNRPTISYVSLMDFYIDPNCPSPNVKDARYAIRRVQMTIADIESYREKEGFKVPDKATLLEFSQNKPTTQGDQTKGYAETGMMGWWSPWVDSSADPANARIEVLVYWNEDRLVWLANRKHVLYNEPNPVGFIPFYNVFYVDMLDRFYGLAVTDVLEGEQHLQEGVIDGRLDELALSIHTPTVKKRGTTLFPHQMKRRPSQVLEVDEPGKDLTLLFPQNVTQQSFMEVMYSSLRAQSATGVSELAVLGVPASGGNSASRTATGVNTQAEASSSRIQYNVECIEMGCLEPLLDDWHLFNTRWIKDEEKMEVLGPLGEILQLDPIGVKNADVRFSMRASARMRARMAMLQTFPQLAQTFLNSSFLDLLAKQQGKTVNIMELAQLLLDALEYPNRLALFRDLTPEEKQAMNQPPAEVVMKEQMQNARIQAAKENTETKVEGDLTKEVVKQMLSIFVEKRKKQEEGEEE